MASHKWKHPELAKPLEPIKVQNLLAELLVSPNKTSPSTQKLIEEKSRRLLLLFDEFDVEKFNWVALSIALAELSIPGLRVAKGKAGRTTSWQPYDYAELKIEMDKIVLEKGCSHAAAAAFLIARSKNSADSKYRAMTAPTLRRYYSKADDRLVKAMHAANSWDAIQDSLNVSK